MADTPGTTIVIKQDFRDEDPDRIAELFRRNIDDLFRSRLGFPNRGSQASIELAIEEMLDQELALGVSRDEAKRGVALSWLRKQRPGRTWLGNLAYAWRVFWTLL